MNTGFPKRITIELTNRCNVSCVFCHRNDFDMKLGDMTEELFKKIIDEMSEHLPIGMVPFFRGESMLHPKFIEFIHYAKERGIKPIQFASNGLLLTEEMSRLILDAEIDFISFSLDTLDSELYKKTRVYGNLEKSMNHIRKFIELSDERRRKGKKTPEIQVSTVNIEEYKERQDEFVSYWRKYADVVRVYEEHDQFGGLKDPKVREELSFLNIRKPCKKLYTDMVICWDGSISLCCYDWNEKHDFANVKNQTIVQIWNGIEYQKLRDMNKKGIFEDDYICKKCEHWKRDYVSNMIIGKSYNRVHEEN